MFFQTNLASFKRGKDKRKRKTKLGSLSLLTTLGATAAGMGLGIAASGLLAKKRLTTKPLFSGAIAGGLLGGGVGYYAGQKLDKRMGFGKYQKQ